MEQLQRLLLAIALALLAAIGLGLLAARRTNPEVLRMMEPELSHGACENGEGRRAGPRVTER